MLYDAVQIQEMIPHRYPFLFVDGVVEVGEDSLVARRVVSQCDPILQGHFPGNPILPGVVQVEAMAQAAVILAHLKGHFTVEDHNCYFIGIDKAKFRAPVRPGSVLDIRITALRVGRVGKFEGEVVDAEGNTCSSASFTAMIEKK